MSVSLAAFHRLAGERVIETAHALWVPHGRFSLMAVPSTRPLDLHPDEARQALRQSRRLMAVALSTRPTGCQVAVHMLRERGFGLHSVQRQFRQQLLRGQPHNTVRRLGWQDLAARGLAVNRSMASAGKLAYPGWAQEEIWGRFCRESSALEGLEVWGSFVDGVLAAFLWWWVDPASGIAHGLALHWLQDREWARPCHCLLFEVSRSLMARPGIVGFTVGRQVVPARTGLDRFKRHAGFRPEPHPLAVVPRAGWEPLLTGALPIAALRRLRGCAADRWPVLENLELLEWGRRCRLYAGGWLRPDAPASPGPRGDGA